MLKLLFFLLAYTNAIIIHHPNVTEFDFRRSAEVLNFDKSEKLVLLRDYGSHVLLGARNHAYNLSLLTLRKNEIYEWPTSESSRKSCEAISPDITECDNYIRTFFTVTSSTFALCGTHGMHATCAEFGNGKREPLRRLDGAGMSPYEADVVAPFIQNDDYLFTLNVPELSTSEPMLTRRRISSLARGFKNDIILRTPRGQNTFEQANFISMHQQSEEIISFFSETPQDGETPGLKKVARVAKVCSDDPGGRLSFSKEWSSFVKGRLECAIEEDFQDTLFFNQLASISESSHQFYGAFRSQLAGIGASAICAYEKQTISHTLSSGLKYDSNLEKCPRASTLDQFLALRHRPLSRSKISSKPLFVYHGKDRFQSVLVQEDVEDLAGKKYNILFIATNLGNLFKIVLSKDETGFSRHACTLKVLPTNSSVSSMKIYSRKISNDQVENNLIIFTGNNVIKLPSAACERAKSCVDCLKMGDPECAWNDEKAECSRLSLNTWSRKFLSQDSGTCRPDYEKKPVQNAPLQPPKETCKCETPVKTSTCTYEVTQKEIRKSASSEFPEFIPAILLISFGLFIGALTNQFVGCCFQSIRKRVKKTPTPIGSLEPIDAYKSPTSPMTASYHSNGRPTFGLEASMTTSSIKTYC